MREDYRSFKKALTVAMGVVAILGTISHFVYEWANENWVIGFFFPINESTWEHLKLMYFPMLLVFGGLWKLLKKQQKRKVQLGLEDERARLLTLGLGSGILVASWSIPFLFYTYRGILGFGILWADMGTFYMSLIVAYAWILHLIKNSYRIKTSEWIVCFLLVLQGIAFIWFTYHPPGIGLFAEP